MNWPDRLRKAVRQYVQLSIKPDNGVYHVEHIDEDGNTHKVTYDKLGVLMHEGD